MKDLCLFLVKLNSSRILNIRVGFIFFSNNQQLTSLNILQQSNDQLKEAITQIALVWLNKEKTLLKIKEQVEKAASWSYLEKLCCRAPFGWN